MASKTIQITCQGAGTIAIGLLKALQGDLKILAKEDYERLKSELLLDGFSFPVAVWEDPSSGNLYILDGHQRVKTLQKMAEEGYSIPQIPIVTVQASDISQAKHKLLAAASQYGQMRTDGLKEFLKDTDFNAEDLLGSFRFADLDLHDFVQSLLDNGQDVLDVDNVVIGGDTVIAMPQSGSVSTNDPVTAPMDNADQVRMVQLFLNGKTQPEFLNMIVRLQAFHKTANLTETVMEVMRAAYSDIE